MPWVRAGRLSISCTARSDRRRFCGRVAPPSRAARAGGARLAGACGAAGDARRDGHAALERSGRRSCAPRCCASRRATACSTSSCRRRACLEDYLESGRGGRSHAPRARATRRASRATSRPPIRGSRNFKVTPDPGVIEVNIHPSASWDELGGTHHAPLRGGAQRRAAHRKVHARRPPQRHRRRQPLRARRRDARRQPVPAPARPAAQPDRLLAQPPVALVPVLGPVHRARRARRRASTRRATIQLYELEIAFQQLPSQRATVAAVARRPVVPQPADRRHRQHAPRRVLHRQAVLARTAPRAAWACSSCAPSRCRRTRA